MCGICGILHPRGTRPVDGDVLRAMNDVMEHRGPDDSGVFMGSGVGLAMRRLSIIDLVGGGQPMSTPDGLVQVVYNGEIYNYREVRADLESRGYRFRTSCDTEVIPFLYREYGDRFPERLNGMFGIAVWDVTARRLLLVRDRLGIKPVYYADLGETFLFGSELKALLRHPDLPRDIDPGAFSEYLTFQHAMAPRTILSAVRKLPAGHMLKVDAAGVGLEQWWDLRFPEPDESASEATHVESFRDVFHRSVERRLVSDVPLGVFLSGGLDSSAVVGAMAHLEVPNIRTYSVGYRGGDIYGELGHARAVAEALGAEHHELLIGYDDYVRELERFLWHMDEPVADEASIPLMLLSARARQDVKVMLSGEGADEVLAGYGLEGMQARFDRLRRFQRIPSLLREGLPRALGPLIPPRLQSALGRANRDLATINAEERHTMVWAFDAETKERICPWLADSADPCPPILADIYRRSGTRDPLHQVLYVYSKIWLAENVLMKADKMTMAHSIELRVPFLDHELVEQVARIPSRYKVRREASGQYSVKSILKRAMRGAIPDAVIDRPKLGFPVPLDKWFQESLSGYCRDVLLSSDARNAGYYDLGEVERLLTAHGRRSTFHTTFQIKNLLFFEVWRQGVLNS